MAWTYKLRVCLISTTAVLLIILAVAFTGLRAFLPYATEYLTEIQKTLSDQLGLPVYIDSIDADMSWFTPRLKLVGVVIYDKDSTKELLHLDEAIFSLAYIDSLTSLSPKIGEITLVGADLNIERHQHNRWLIQGVEFVGDGSNAPSSELLTVMQNTSFTLADSDVRWTDHASKSESMDFIGVNLIFESFLGEHSLAVDMQLPGKYGDSFRFVAKIDDDLENYKTAEWEIYLEGQTVKINNWVNKLNLKNMINVSGTLDGKVWLTLKNKKLLRVTGDLSANTLYLKNEALTEHQWNADYVATKFDWQKMKKGWRLDVGDLRVVKNSEEWSEAANLIVTNNDASGLRFSATYLRPFDFLTLPGVFIPSGDLPALEKIQSLYLGGDLYNIEVHYPVDREVAPAFSAVFVDLDVDLDKERLIVNGADGILAYSEGQLELKLLSESLNVDFGDVFRKPVSADVLTGRLAARRVDRNWIIESSDIHLLNADIEARSRLKLIAHQEGHIFIDLQTNFINARGAVAHNYYPLPVMSNTLVSWLDNAITDGVVDKGGFILFGDIDRFPYIDNDGVMEVVFSGSDLTLHFLDGWPDIQQLTGDVRFYNSSLSIENGTGRTYAGSIKHATALIPDLSSPRLFVKGDIATPADDLQKYIWNSGLNDILGDAMNQFQAIGKLGLELSLDIPLDNADEIVKTKGKLTFDNNELYFPAMEYSLKGLSGKLFFTEKDMSGSGMIATFENSPVNINIDSSDDALSSEIIININGNLPIDGLLKRFDWVPDYWLSGASDWDVFVHIPDKAEEYSLRIEMQSALEGTAINVSDVVSKPRNDQLQLEMTVDVLDEGLQVDAGSADLWDLFATRNDDAHWDFVVDSTLIRGSGEFAEDLNKSSTVKLNLEYVRLLDLFYSSDTSSSSVQLSPTMFPSLNIFSKKLTWNDWEFNNTNLKTSWNAHGMLIQSIILKGPSLKVSGRGSWLSSWKNKNETNLKLFVSSSDLGDTLSMLKLSESMSRGELVATVDWQWPAEPYRFSLSSVKGSANIELSNGEVTDLQPGTGGRLLGLFNVFKLGDRLALDFEDVYKEGFSFDSVVGDLKFNEGNAYTNNTDVKAAAADMKISGRVGIVEHDYDLSMKVKPHSSAAAFTGGTIAGGPVVGAALVVLNKLLGLEKISRDEYDVTGSWDNPNVKQTSKRKEQNKAEINDLRDESEDEL